MALDVSSVTINLPHAQGEVQHANPSVAQQQAAAAQQAALAAAVQEAERPKPEPIIPSDLEQTIKDLQKLSEAFNHRLSFSINEKLDSVVVKVIDSRTDKVVREIPPAELQHVYEAIRETIGLLFDHKA